MYQKIPLYDFAHFLSIFSNFRQVSFANDVVVKCAAASLNINDRIKSNVNQVKQQQQKNFVNQKLIL
jgi:hypothetical protein